MTRTTIGGVAEKPRLQSNPALLILDDLLAPAPTVEPRQMFGHSCYAVAGKVFACAVDGRVALKLPPSVIAELDDPAIGPFQPGGREMGSWIEINRPEEESFERDTSLIELALVAISEAAAGHPRA